MSWFALADLLPRLGRILTSRWFQVLVLCLICFGAGFNLAAQRYSTLDALRMAEAERDKARETAEELREAVRLAQAVRDAAKAEMAILAAARQADELRAQELEEILNDVHVNPDAAQPIPPSTLRLIDSLFGERGE